MIGADWCGKCQKAKVMLDKRGIPYEYIDYDRDVRAPHLEDKYGFEHLPFFLLIGDDNQVVRTEDSVVHAIKVCSIALQSDE